MIITLTCHYPTIACSVINPMPESPSYKPTDWLTDWLGVIIKIIPLLEAARDCYHVQFHRPEGDSMVYWVYHISRMSHNHKLTKSPKNRDRSICQPFLRLFFGHVWTPRHFERTAGLVCVSGHVAQGTAQPRSQSWTAGRWWQNMGLTSGLTMIYRMKFKFMFPHSLWFQDRHSHAFKKKIPYLPDDFIIGSPMTPDDPGPRRAAGQVRHNSPTNPQVPFTSGQAWQCPKEIGDLPKCMAMKSWGWGLKQWDLEFSQHFRIQKDKLRQFCFGPRGFGGVHCPSGCQKTRTLLRTEIQPWRHIQNPDPVDWACLPSNKRPYQIIQRVCYSLLLTINPNGAS